VCLLLYYFIVLPMVHLQVRGGAWEWGGERRTETVLGSQGAGALLTTSSLPSRLSPFFFPSLFHPSLSSSQAVANPKESRRPCPKCLEDVAAGATVCPHCTSSIPISATLKARMDADVTGEIQADLEDVQNNTPSYFNFRSWMPGRA